MQRTILAILIWGLSSATVGWAQQAPSSGTQQAPASTSQKPPAAKTTPRPTSSTTTKPFTLKTDRDKESYALGMNLAKGLKSQSIDVDPAIIARAIKDVLSGAKPLLTEEEATAELKQLQTEVRAKLAEKNREQGHAFLAANKDKEGVVVLPDGLQYKVLTQGNGPVPKPSDTVVCQYRGTFVDGTEFDSSARNGGRPAAFPVSRVIKGWSEALEMMPVGSKWQLFVPSDLAYGERGFPPLIGPNAVLIFEIDLLSIEARQSQAPNPGGAPAQPAQPNPNPPNPSR
jgi:FKBP-type peptidyl-prolyl cis-trans isomerase FklB